MQESRHPSWDELAGYAERELDEAAREAVARHLEDCVLCRLEVKRIERFHTIADDGELLEEAEWNRARADLEQAWREGIRPGLVQEDRVADTGPISLTRRRERRSLRLAWLLPAAAAATLLLFALWRGGGPDPGQDPLLRNPLRGEAADASAIALFEPSGVLRSMPGRFVWQSGEEFDSYALEIFTAELETLYRVDRLSEGPFAVPDSLKEMLVEEKVYLWSVEGWQGLDRMAVSPTAWFRFSPIPADSLK